jgi:Mg2+-importing ATPase
MRITALMVGFVFLVNIVKGSHQILDSLIFAIAIAVGLTPELLPVIMTVTLSKGSLRMAKKHAVVRTLPAIQNLGAMTILATDKTGTLTEDHITLVSCVDVAGNDSDAVFSHAYLSSIFHTQRTSPLDTAIRAFRSLDTSEYKKVDEVPFDFSRKRDSIVYDHKSTRYLVVKGAPEGMFPVCTLLEKNGETIPFSTTLREEARTRYNALSANGFRVLALAYKKIPQATQSEYTKEEECDLIFLGFSAFMDPPKESAKEALRSLAELGVSVKIITGDSEVLTERICRDIGLPIEGVLSGEQIAHMSDTQLATLAPHTTVFARVPPDGKERVVRALRAQGAVVGYLGDGINDAPALKMADVGISVNNAVDVAKETADVILLTKGLDILADGIREGRITFQNTMKYVRMAFSSNFGNMASMSVASAALPFLPMSPAQILLNNFLYDLSQTSLPSDRVDADDLKKPLSWNMKDIRHYMITFGLVSSLFDCATFFLLFKVFGLTDGAFQTGWFIESIATQILVVFIIRTKKFPLFAQAPSRGVLATTFGIIVIASLIPFTFLGAHLGFIPLTTHTMLAIVAIVACYLVVAEVTKYLFYKSERATK